MSARLSSADVGNAFLGPDGRVWRLVAYCSEPTATFERLEHLPAADGQTPARTAGAVGSPILAPFRRLLPEAD